MVARLKFEEESLEEAKRPDLPAGWWTLSSFSETVQGMFHYVAPSLAKWSREVTSSGPMHVLHTS